MRTRHHSEPIFVGSRPINRRSHRERRGQIFKLAPSSLGETHLNLHALLPSSKIAATFRACERRWTIEDAATTAPPQPRSLGALALAPWAGVERPCDDPVGNAAPGESCRNLIDGLDTVNQDENMLASARGRFDYAGEDLGLSLAGRQLERDAGLRHCYRSAQSRRRG